MRDIWVGLLSLCLLSPLSFVWAAEPDRFSSPDSTVSCARFFSDNSALVTSAPEDRVALLPVGYHVMPSLFEKGLDGVRQQLPQLAQMSRWLWLGPIHEQTTLLHKYVTPEGVHGETPNDAFYWPLDHSSVAPLLGGEESFKQLVSEARDQGVQIFVDAVIGHFGYVDEEDTLIFNGKEVTLNEISQHIRPDNSVNWFDWNRLENTSDPQEVLEQQDIMATKRLHGLPGLIHEHAEVKEHLVNSYKRFIDMGVTGFRIDAVLYVNRDFIAEFINELNAYAGQQGQELTFVLELLVNKDDVLRPIMDDILDKVDDKERVYFLDFPLMYEFRRIHTEPLEYDFDWLLKFMAHRIESGVSYWRLIPTIVNHDFGEIMSDAMDEKIIYALTEFLSFQPSLLFHGSEQSGALSSNRQVIEVVNGDGDMAELVNRFHHELEAFRKDQDRFIKTHSHIVERDTLLLEKQGENSSLFLYVHKNDESADVQIPRPPSKKDGEDIHVLYSAGEVQAQPQGRGLSVRSEGKSLLLFEVKHSH